MARPKKKPGERPVLMFHTCVRVYADEPEIAAYFAQYKPSQYAAAIKRAVRVAMTGGGLNLNQMTLPTAPEDADEDVAAFFSDFVS